MKNYFEERETIYKELEQYGKQVVGYRYKGYTITIEYSEYCLKDKNDLNKTIFTSGHEYEIVDMINKLEEEMNK